MTKYQVQVVVEQDEDGLFVAECPALQGCYAQGQTADEAVENIKDVVAMCIQEARAEGREIDLDHPIILKIQSVGVQV